MGVDFNSPVLHYKTIDKFIEVSDQQGIEMIQQLAKSSGLLIGPSSGAVAHAAFNYAKSLKKDDLCVIIFGDSGRAYLSKNWL